MKPSISIKIFFLCAILSASIAGLKAQNRVTGIVTSSDTDEPLVGVSVVIETPQNGGGDLH